jgi:hypothetical protein
MIPEQSTVYTSWHIWNVAADAASQAKVKKAAQPKVVTADSVSAIILSAVATEAFINELGAHLSSLQKLELKNAEDWITVGILLEEFEAERMQVAAKYLFASKLLPGKPLKKGEQPFQNFQLLIATRNDFVYPKAQQKPPKYFAQLERLELTYHKKTDEPKLAGWMTQLATPEMACWACRSAHDIIWNIIERFRDASHMRVGQLYQDMKFQWGKTLNDKRVS